MASNYETAYSENMRHARDHIVEQLKRVVRNAERRGITQYRLAQLAGINRAQLIRLMRGTVAPRLDDAALVLTSGELSVAGVAAGFDGTVGPFDGSAPPAFRIDVEARELRLGEGPGPVAVVGAGG